jgi:eukaryotic-like serine/threonine-protein kinase
MNMRKHVMLAAVSALAVVALAPAADAYKIPGVCKVPKVAGDSLVGAAGALKSANCTVGNVTTIKSKTVAAGHVVSSAPPAGTTHKEGFSVNLVVSIGSPKSSAVCKVPNVKGDGTVAAESKLIGANCGIGPIKSVKSKKVAKGHVISSSPGAGATLKAGSKVKLTVSSGKH